ncbi:MAG: hypothetical protein QOG45_1687 [Chloroflexota bacterium]|jgi:hypothetical protein|nr:hypothetical protein [Chloroflexota bacterium]
MAMARSYYSTVFEQTADRIWSVIRDFGNHSVWVDGVTESHIEEGRPGDAVGSIRSVAIGDLRIRQQLVAHSDIDRSYTYDAREPYRFPVQNFRATLRVTPIVDGSRAFVEWWATFDCAPDERDRWTAYFEHEGFATWLRSLRARLESSTG